MTKLKWLFNAEMDMGLGTFDSLWCALCAWWHWFPLCIVVTKDRESAIAVQQNAHVVCFPTSCLWPLWRVSLPSLLQQGEINTSNVMHGQWNKGMIYVGMATPQMRWVMCLLARWGKRRRGRATVVGKKWGLLLYICDHSSLPPHSVVSMFQTHHVLGQSRLIWSLLCY